MSPRWSLDPSRRIRVALLTPTMLTGGAERQMLLLAHALPRERYEVRFLLMAERGPLADQAEALGLPVHSLGLERSILGRPSFRAASDIALALRRYRRLARHVDIVDAWLAPAYSFAAVLQPIARVPVLLAGRRNLHDVARSRSQVRTVADRLALGTADAIVANSQAGADDLLRTERVHPERVHVIRNAVLPASTTLADRRRIRAGWHVTDDQLLVGCVANLKPGKGHDSLLEVATAVRHSHPGIRYVLVGEGPERPAIEAGIRERGLANTITLHGADPNARALLGAFDMVFHASETESLPNSVMEAAAAGLPIIATNVGGTREILTDDRDGILVEPHDHAAMVVAMTRLADEPGTRQRLGAQAARRIAEFSPQRLAAQTDELYTALLSSLGDRSGSRP